MPRLRDIDWMLMTSTSSAALLLRADPFVEAVLHEWLSRNLAAWRLKEAQKQGRIA